MGPLGKLWVQMDSAIQQKKKQVSVFEVLDLIEKAVCLLGQSSNTIAQQRRLGVMARFMRDVPRAKQILTENTDVLERKRGNLFGSTFYKSLHKKAKRSASSQDITRQLGQQTKRRRADGPRPFQRPPLK